MAAERAGLRAALRHFDRHDPTIARLLRAAPHVRPLRRRRDGFDSLVAALIHQQVSIAAGRSILRRFRAACGGRISPARVLALSTGEFRAAGISRQKMAYIRDLAGKVASGAVNFRAVARAADEKVVESLTQVKGIGTWTAKMFLLFHLARPDVVSPEDLGLRIAAARAYSIPMSRAAGFLERRAKTWTPMGTLACLALWANKDGAPKKG